MAKGKKYDYRVAQASDNSAWSAEIIRQVTSKKTMTSKSQDGFATEAEAVEWGQAELKLFMQGQAQRNKRRDTQREALAKQQKNKELAEAEQKAAYAATLQESIDAESSMESAESGSDAKETMEQD